MTFSFHVLREQFVQFRNECEWIRSCYNTYRSLWESTDRPLNLMAVSAPGFFNDLNRVLIEYLGLRICMITDPAVSKVRGVEKANLTCHFLNDELSSNDAMTDEIQRLTQDLVRLRAFLLPARNQRLAHLDMETTIDGQTLGDHPQEETDLFFRAMQDYCDAVGRAVGEGPLDFRGAGRGPGDVLDLIRLIEYGLVEKERRR